MRLFLFFLLIPISNIAAITLGLETGYISNQYNKQRIPGDSGTEFDLAPSLPASSTFYRLQGSFSFNEKSGIRLLYAPLKLSGSKQFNQDINFQGRTFSSTNEIKTLYQFNSYRATYFKSLYKSNQSLLKVGLTLKVRDAKVGLTQGNLEEKKENIGFVPLLYLNYELLLPQNFRLCFDFDGLIAPQGRALDAALIFGNYLKKNIRINAGYRVLEGGADNKKVYNFSLFHYFFTALEFNF